MVYPARTPDATLSAQTSPALQRTDTKRSAVFIYYAARMSREQIAAAVRAMLDGDFPVTTWLIFESYLDGDDRQRMLKHLETSSSASPQVWIVMAEWHAAADRDEQARSPLQRTHCCCGTLPNSSDLQTRSDKLATELGMPSAGNAVFPAELLQAAGFSEITSAGIPDRELALDEPALFYARSGDQLVTIAVRIIQQTAAGGPNSYAMSHVEAWNGGPRSWSTGSMSHSVSIAGLARVNFQATQVGQQPQFRLTASLQ